MKPIALYTLALSILLSGCDTISGVTRSADLRSFPDIRALKAKIESYPEIDEVILEEREGSRPLKLSGIKPADQVFYLRYSGGESVRGTLMFIRDFQGKVGYHQSLLAMNRLPPQDWIDETWPIMKRIESDMEKEFGFDEIPETLRVSISRVEDPERKDPNQSVDTTPVRAAP